MMLIPSTSVSMNVNLRKYIGESIDNHRKEAIKRTKPLDRRFEFGTKYGLYISLWFSQLRNSWMILKRRLESPHLFQLSHPLTLLRTVY